MRKDGLIMAKKLYVGLRKTGSVFSTLLNIFLIAVLVIVLVNNYNITQNNQESFFTYQPVYIQTGSMEPTLREGAIILTQRVTDIEELAVDDIVTYVVYDTQADKEVFITHRIYAINEDGTIITKGDNNRVTDSYMLTMDNIKAKVIYTWNGAATIKNMLNTRAGQVYIISIIIALVLILVAFSNLISFLDEKCGYAPDEKAKKIKENTEINID